MGGLAECRAAPKEGPTAASGGLDAPARQGAGACSHETPTGTPASVYLQRFMKTTGKVAEQRQSGRASVHGKNQDSLEPRMH